MKITNRPSANIANAELAKTEKAGAESILDSKKKPRTSPLEATANSSAKIDLSPRAQDIKRAKELATPSDTIDEAKVARLQKLIDEGKYKVNSEAIADKLVDEHLLMS